MGRNQFGRPLAANQLIQKKLADAVTEITHLVSRGTEVYFSAAHILSRNGMKGMNPSSSAGRRAPSSGTWPPPWSASHRGWSGDGTDRGTAWCCRHFCRTASGSQRSRGSLPGPCCPWRPCRWGRPGPWSASSEFIELMKRKSSETDQMESLKEAFKIFDKNKSGYIEAKELKAVTTTLGQSLSSEEFEAFWREADVNGDGKLDYEEFIKIMSQY